MDDFTPVAHIGSVDYVVMVAASVTAKSVLEFIEFAKANPGKLNYASAGNGSATQLVVAANIGALPFVKDARVRVLAKPLQDPAMLERLAKQGVEPRAMSPEARSVRCCAPILRRWRSS